MQSPGSDTPLPRRLLSRDVEALSKGVFAYRLKSDGMVVVQGEVQPIVRSPDWVDGQRPLARRQRSASVGATVSAHFNDHAPKGFNTENNSWPRSVN